jgi:hypothetical protein
MDVVAQEETSRQRNIKVREEQTTNKRKKDK